MSHPAVFFLPAMKRVVADSKSPAEIADPGDSFVLFEAPYDLLVVNLDFRIGPPPICRGPR